MASIHIVREHALGMEGARRLALRWVEVARSKLQMECSYTEGQGHDVVSFQRPGASGHLKVGRDRFQLDARLGLLLGVFKQKIETEIVRNLDELLAHEDPLHAFDQGLARHEAKRHAARAGHAESHKPVARAAPGRKGK